MSLSDLVSGGADCGPSNALSNLGKRFGQDRSTQQDRFGQRGSGSSGPLASSSFRSSQAGPSSVGRNPNFFQQQQQQQHHQQQTFDLAQLRGSLPFAPPVGPLYSPPPPNFEASFHRQPPPSVQQRQPNNAPKSDWAAAFMTQNSAPAVARQDSPQLQSAPSHMQQQQQIGVGMGMGMHAMQRPAFMGQMDVGPSMMGMNMMHQQQHHTPALMDASHVQRSDARVDILWDSAFTAFEQGRATESVPASTFKQPLAEQQQPRQQDPQDADDLARAAGHLVSTVEHETNSKFQQSQFLNLMRKIRDREAGIQGTDIVEGDAPMMRSGLDKGKGKEVERDFSNGQTTSMPRPTTQKEAYEWARELMESGQGNLLQQHRNGSSSTMAPPHLSAAQDMDGRSEMADMWAEQDAQSEAIEWAAREKAAQAFVGDAGDVHARMAEDDANAREFARYQNLHAGVAGASDMWTENMDQQDEDDLQNQDFVGRGWEAGTKGRGVRGAQDAEWDKLQQDWDDFEVTSAGISNVRQRRQDAGAPLSALRAPAYTFMRENPYVQTTRTHAMHSGVAADGLLDSVLEREAAVQADPSNASAWLELGVKQQENEREGLAIAALHRAIQLDPSLREAWLALAVSYTNENDQTAALEAVDRWIGASERYAGVVAAHEALNDESRYDTSISNATRTLAQRHAATTSTLIAIARHGSAQGEVDADVQVALGVLFNASEDYDKAVDCFSAALGVRPDDWLLYNRLGATLSNSGRSEEAIGYYHHALSLQPGFVRCHFNLSISCLNLKMYADAAEHIFTALTLQQAENAQQEQLLQGAGGAGADMHKEAGVTSSSLWETFRVALEFLNRPDLADLCANRDINAFDASDLAPRSRDAEV